MPATAAPASPPAASDTPASAARPRLWVPSRVLVTRSAQEREHGRAIVARAEALGFAPAEVRLPDGPQRLAQVRNNYRVAFTDATLASTLWERVREHVPGSGRSAGPPGCRSSCT